MERDPSAFLGDGEVRIDRVWAMPNHKTFEIKPIKRLIRDELSTEYTDPFPHPYDRDALQMLKDTPNGSVSRLAFDPVYSLRQLKEMYDSRGISLTQHETQYYWSDLREQIARVLAPNGVVACFGWNSVGLGQRGFEMTRILIVCHGGHHNDTICTVEKKVQTTL